MRITSKFFASLADSLLQALDGRARNRSALPMGLAVGSTAQQMVMDRDAMPVRLEHVVLVNGVCWPFGRRLRGTEQ